MLLNPHFAKPQNVICHFKKPTDQTGGDEEGHSIVELEIQEAFDCGIPCFAMFLTGPEPRSAAGDRDQFGVHRAFRTRIQERLSTVDADSVDGLVAMGRDTLIGWMLEEIEKQRRFAYRPEIELPRDTGPTLPTGPRAHRAHALVRAEDPLWHPDPWRFARLDTLWTLDRGCFFAVVAGHAQDGLKPSLAEAEATIAGQASSERIPWNQRTWRTIHFEDLGVDGARADRAPQQDARLVRVPVDPPLPERLLEEWTARVGALVARESTAPRGPVVIHLAARNPCDSRAAATRWRDVLAKALRGVSGSRVEIWTWDDPAPSPARTDTPSQDVVTGGSALAALLDSLESAAEVRGVGGCFEELRTAVGSLGCAATARVSLAACRAWPSDKLAAAVTREIEQRRATQPRLADELLRAASAFAPRLLAALLRAFSSSNEPALRWAALRSAGCSDGRIDAVLRGPTEPPPEALDAVGVSARLGPACADAIALGLARHARARVVDAETAACPAGSLEDTVRWLRVATQAEIDQEDVPTALGLGRDVGWPVLLSRSPSRLSLASIFRFGVVQRAALGLLAPGETLDPAYADAVAARRARLRPSLE